MTDIELQKDIVSELKVLLNSKGIMMPLGGKFASLHVYEQDIPLKQDEDDEMQRNYIVVMIGEEESDGNEWDVEVHFSIGVEDRDKDCSGNKNILYLMNEIFIHFMKSGIIGRHCRMEKKAYKALNLEAPFPYYEGDLITHWKLPLPKEEGLEDFI